MYKEKYLKYKNKYLRLKQQYGGEIVQTAPFNKKHISTIVERVCLALSNSGFSPKDIETLRSNQLYLKVNGESYTYFDFPLSLDNQLKRALINFVPKEVIKLPVNEERNKVKNFIIKRNNPEELCDFLASHEDPFSIIMGTRADEDHMKSIIHILCRIGDADTLATIKTIFRNKYADSDERFFSLMTVSDDEGRIPLMFAMRTLKTSNNNIQSIINFIKENTPRELWNSRDSNGCTSLDWFNLATHNETIKAALLEKLQSEGFVRGECRWME
jgi:hypothetical protein